MDIQINLAAMEQASSIAAILRQAFLEYEALYTPEAFAATTPTAAQIQNRWNEGPVWAALNNDKIIGTVAAVPKNKSLYIRSMALIPAARGHGVGKSLLHEIERFAMENDFQRMYLSTTPFLHPAISLYEGFGFKRKEEGPHTLFGTPLFTMEKTLVPKSKGHHVT